MTTQAGNTAHRCQHSHGQRLSFPLAVLLLFMVQLQAFISTADDVTSSNDPPSSTVHNSTLAWIATVSLLEESMNRSVDPCQDFYQYSCGNCGQTNRPQDGEMLQRTMMIRLKGLLERSESAATEAKYIQNTKNLYKSCMNEDKLRELGTFPLRELVKKLGPWPLTSSGSSKGFQDLETTLVNLAYVGVKPFFQLRVDHDIHNNSRLVIWLYEGTVSIPQQYLLMPRNSTVMVTYELFYLSLAQHVLGLPPSRALNESISEVVDFEVELAKIYPNSTNTDESSTSSDEDTGTLKVYLDGMDALLPNFKWKKFLTTFFQRAYVDLSPDTLIAIDYSHLLNLTILIDQTDNRVVLNYLLMRLVHSFYKYLHQEIRDLDRPMRKALYGVNDAKPRWKTCVQMTTDAMSQAVGSLYVREYFSPAQKKKAEKFVEFIRESMKDVIRSAQWIDNSTKAKAVEKADEIMANVGYPDYLLNETIMESGHKYHNFKPEAYFQNVLQLHRKGVAGNANGLHGPPPSKGEWSVSSTEINAFYKPQTNVMTFPAAIFQPPYCGDNITDSQMFGRLGVMAGHELTHAFDDSGRLFDKEGNWASWWSNESIANFNELADCFVEQYGKHNISGVPVDGMKTLSENIADNGGVKVALKAFRKWESMYGQQPTLPGSGLTHDQIFFISMAQLWCTVQTHEEAKTNVMTSVHSPEDIRTVKVVSNSEEFAEAFNCSVGSKMNPVTKCELW